MRSAIVFIVALFLSFPAFALDVTGIRFGDQGVNERIVIELSDNAAFKTYTMTNPDRVIVDLPAAGWKIGGIQKPVSSVIKDIRHGAVGKNQMRIVLESGGAVLIAKSFALSADKTHPNRIVLDIARGANDATKQNIAASTTQEKDKPSAMDKDARPYSASTVQNLAARMPLPAPNRQRETGARVTRDTAKKAAVHAAIESAQERQEKTNDTPTQDIVDIAPVQDYTPPPSGKNRQKPLIIIDPGHGGQDPGARAANGNFEKSIVLAVGLELKDVLEKSGQYRVQMTRDTDVFIPLKERVKFARRNGGDLFVSLHADSMRDATVTGASVYTLSDTASDKETEKLAERENKSDAIAGVNLSNQDNDVANILIDLASRDTMNQSRYLANTVVSTMPNNGVNMLARQPHRSAGFAVLKALDIPSILVEMGYLTNLEEANRLSSREYRTRIARGLKSSIDSYFVKVAKLNSAQ